MTMAGCGEERGSEATGESGLEGWAWENQQALPRRQLFSRKNLQTGVDLREVVEEEGVSEEAESEAGLGLEGALGSRGGFAAACLLFREFDRGLPCSGLGLEGSGLTCS